MFRSWNNCIYVSAKRTFEYTETGFNLLYLVSECYWIGSFTTSSTYGKYVN